MTLHGKQPLTGQRPPQWLSSIMAKKKVLQKPKPRKQLRMQDKKHQKWLRGLHKVFAVCSRVSVQQLGLMSTLHCRH